MDLSITRHRGCVAASDPDRSSWLQLFHTCRELVHHNNLLQLNLPPSFTTSKTNQRFESLYQSSKATRNVNMGVGVFLHAPHHSLIAPQSPLQAGEAFNARTARVVTDGGIVRTETGSSARRRYSSRKLQLATPGRVPRRPCPRTAIATRCTAGWLRKLHLRHVTQICSFFKQSLLTFAQPGKPAYQAYPGGQPQVSYSFHS